VNEDKKAEVVVTFLSSDDGGRKTPARLTEGVYRPHLVVQDPNIREYQSGDDYVGVYFEAGPEQAMFGKEWSATVMVWLRPREVLPPGATFTIREGRKVVGWGTVERWVS
jgi:translation elongation factor EF-Tu-like GTPase